MAWYGLDVSLSSDDEGRFYDPEEKVVPRLSHVSCWDLYPDPSALSLEDAEYVIERHRMNRSQLRALRHRPFFDVDAIEACLTMGSSYEERHLAKNAGFRWNDAIKGAWSKRMSRRDMEKLEFLVREVDFYS